MALLTFREVETGTTFERTTGADGFDTVTIGGIAEGERARLASMEGGYTIETAALILPYFRQGVTAHAAHKALGVRVGRATVYAYYTALNGAPLSKKKRAKR